MDPGVTGTATCSPMNAFVEIRSCEFPRVRPRNTHHLTQPAHRQEWDCAGDHQLSGYYTGRATHVHMVDSVRVWVLTNLNGPGLTIDLLRMLVTPVRWCISDRHSSQKAGIIKRSKIYHTNISAPTKTPRTYGMAFSKRPSRADAIHWQGNFLTVHTVVIPESVVSQGMNDWA